MSDGPRLYKEFASWWPLLSAPADYAEEAAFYYAALADKCARRPRTILELGSGGGNNAFHMKAHAELTLVDVAPNMLGLSRAVNPECEHVEGDMRSVRLFKQFDAVFVHDAVCYMTTEADLRQAMETAFVHCAPGGAVLFAPDYVRETFRPTTDSGGHDGSERGMRYLEWTWDPDPSDTTYLVDYAYMFRDAAGGVRVERDRHVEGLFRRDDWRRWLEEAGLTDIEVRPLEHSEVEPGVHVVFLGRKPAG